MKTLSVTLALVCLFALTAPVLTLAKPAYTPHEDPTLARDTPDLVALLTYYSNSFSAAALRKYGDAQSLLNSLSRARIPDELSAPINRFRALASTLYSKIEQADRLLDEAAELVSTNQPQSARLKLDAAAAAIRDARALLSEIDAAARTIKVTTLGAFATPVLRQIETAYVRLEESWLRLSSLLDELSRLQQTLTESQETLVTKLTPATLVLAVNPATAFVGESVTASGMLSAVAILPGRRVALQSDNETITVTTGPSGTFTTTVNIPYLYINQVSFKAIYVPEGADTATYMAAESQPVVINVAYYSTRLEAAVPAETHPGFPTPITGQVVSAGGDTERTIKVFLDDVLLAEKKIQNHFDFDVSPPVNIEPGKHELILTVLPLQRYSGATMKSKVDITTVLAQVNIVTSSLVVLPWDAVISGKITAQGSPIPDARIETRIGQLTNAGRTASDGSFSIRANMPFSFNLAGPQEVRIAITPTEPWYEPIQIRREVFAINPVNILLILLAAGVLAGLLYRRVRPAAPAPALQPVVIASPAQRHPSLSAPVLKPEFIGFKGSILTSYLSAVETITSQTGIALEEPMTLREFLKTTAPKIASSLKAFEGLTVIAELALYSTRQLNAEIAAHAEQQASDIRKELHRAAP